MIIVAVLGILLIILSLTLQLANGAIFSNQYYYKLSSYQKAYYASSSCFEGALQLFSMDDAKIDSLNEIWAQRLPPVEFKDGKIFVVIEDENRKFNLNSMLDQNKKDNEKAIAQFKRLLKLINVRENFANTVLDWMDEDSQTRVPEGAESAGYADFPCKGAPLDSPEELLLLPFLKKEDFYGKMISDKKIPGLIELITVFGGAKVNINTAPNLVLQSLDGAIDEKLASQIIARRQEKPFSSINDLLDMRGIDLNLIYRLNTLADVRSDVFKIKITVVLSDEEFTFINMVERDSANFKLIYRKIE